MIFQSPKVLCQRKNKVFKRRTKALNLYKLLLKLTFDIDKGPYILQKKTLWKCMSLIVDRRITLEKCENI